MCVLCLSIWAQGFFSEFFALKPKCIFSWLTLISRFLLLLHLLRGSCTTWQKSCNALLKMDLYVNNNKVLVINERIVFAYCWCPLLQLHISLTCISSYLSGPVIPAAKFNNSSELHFSTVSSTSCWKHSLNCHFQTTCKIAKHFKGIFRTRRAKVWGQEQTN